MEHGNNIMRCKIKEKTGERGFTLVELLLAMAIAGVVMTAVYTAYSSQQRSYIVQELVAAMQQNLRVAMSIMVRDIRMAGYNPTGSGVFQVTDVRYRDLDYGADPNGNGCLEFTADLDEDGTLDGDETIAYTLYDSGGNGSIDLGKRSSGVRQLLTENIQALAFAYAYDQNGDGELDFVDGNGNGQRDAGEPIIWAIDTDNDNELDVNLDTNGDGAIDSNDDADNDGFVDGLALPGGVSVEVSRIRGVKTWLLARTSQPIQRYSDRGIYVVGDRVITPAGDGCMHRLSTTTVKCRNL